VIGDIERLVKGNKDLEAQFAEPLTQASHQGVDYS
jgi:hypothetical protein